MKRTPVLIDVNGVPLRESLSYNGGGAGFGGQMAEWLPPAQSADAALLPALRLGNARADDLVRNNGIAANAVALHKDHIVGHMFLISYRPNWRWLGMRETAAKSFVDEVEAAWSEYAEGMSGEIDVEEKRTFTEFIREGVGVHAFNGEIFVQPVWDTESTQLFRTRFKAVSPKRVDTPGHGMGNRFLRAGVEVDRYGRAVAYHICEDDFPFSGSGRWERIPRELPTGRPAMLHIFEPVEDGQTRGANQFYSVMERLKMLDSLQATQLQSAIVKAMYAATIESDLDTEKAFEYIAGAPQGQKDNPLINILDKFSTWYDTNSVTLGGVKIPHLFPGDDLKLQTAQDSDNGFSALEQALLRYIAAGLGVSYEQLSRDYSKVSYSSARASANESWRYFMGRRKFIASRLATQMFSCWLEEALLRGIIRPPRARFDFYQARSAWSRAEWIGAGRMAIDGLKEVQESVMRIEAGLSTYEKELALMGEDYQDIFRQQVRESAEREKAGLSRPVWISEQEKSLLTHEKETLEYKRQLAELGDKVEHQKRLNELAQQAARFEQQQSAKQAAISAKARGLTDRQAQRESEEQRLRDVYGDNPDALAKATSALKNTWSAEEQLRGSWMAGLKSGWGEWAESATDSFSQVKSVATQTFDGIAQNMAAMLTGSEQSRS
ncbi:phage portal protein [Escherichia coli]